MLCVTFILFNRYDHIILHKQSKFLYSKNKIKNIKLHRTTIISKTIERDLLVSSFNLSFFVISEQA